MPANIASRPLRAGEVFTQTKRDRVHDVEPVGSVCGLIYSDQAGTLLLEESDDNGANWSTTATVAVSAATNAELAWTDLTKRWYRFKYTNGGAAQTVFTMVQQTRGLDTSAATVSGDVGLNTDTLAAIAGAGAAAKTLADIVTALAGVTLDAEAITGAGAAAKTLADIVTALGSISIDTTGLATSAKQDTLIAKDFATQTTAAAILAKLTADPATQTTLAAILAKLTADPATQTTLAAILSKLIAAPATEAKQDVLAGPIGTPDSAAPAKALMLGVKYSASAPADAHDGDIVSIRGNEHGELVISIGAATVALPIDIQYNSLADSEALPVKSTGSNTRKTATASVTIGTGAAHSIGDVVSTDAGAIMEFDTGLPAGSSGMIIDSITTLNQNAVFSGGAGYTLHLFTVSPTAQATNAAFDLDSLTGWIGAIEIGTLVDLGSNCAKNDTQHQLSFTLAAADTKIYGKAVCKGAETTISGKVLAFNLGIMAL